MSLYLPESVQAAQVNAEIESQIDTQIDQAYRWNKELRRIDRDLSLIWSPPQADDSELKAGRWMIRKRVPGSVDAFIPLEGPNGEYREPGVWILEMLQGADMWNDRRRHEREEIQCRIRASKERAYETEREQRLDEAELAVRAAKRLRGPEGFEKRTDLKGHASRSSKRRRGAPEKP